MDNIEIDKPERIIRRHGAAAKPKNKLGFYLYISAGFIILFALLTAIWLLLKDPEIPQSAIYSNSSNEPDILAGETNGVSLPIDINTQSIPEATKPDTTNTVIDSSKEIQNSAENEIALTPPSTANEAVTTKNEIAQPQGAVSSLPLDYALAGNKLITKSNTASQSVETSITTESDKIDLNNKVNNASQATTESLAAETPKTEKVIQTTNIVQSQLNNNAVQITQTPQTQSEGLPKIVPEASTEYTNAPTPANNKNNPGLIESATTQIKPQQPKENSTTQAPTEYTNVPTTPNNKNNPGLIESATTQIKPQQPKENSTTQPSTEYTNVPTPPNSKNNPGLIESATTQIKPQQPKENSTTQPSTEYTNVPTPPNNKNNPGLIESAATQIKTQPAQGKITPQDSSDKANNKQITTESNSLQTSEPKLASTPAIKPMQQSPEPIKQSQLKKPVETATQKKTVTPQTAVINNTIPEGQTIPRPTAPNTITAPTNNPNVQESALSLQSQEKQAAIKSPNKETVSQIKTNQPKEISNTTTKQKIDNGRGGNISIQVASASRPEGLRKIAVEENLTTGRVIETDRNGSKWYILVTGHYGSRNEAQKAIGTLPASLQKNNPWVRETP